MHSLLVLRWRKVPGSSSVTSIFGRSGTVIAEKDDYKWEQLDFTGATLQGMVRNILTASAKEGQIIRWDAVSNRWIPGLEYGVAARPVTNDGLSSNVIGNGHIDGTTISGSKFNDGSLSERTFLDNTVGSDKIADGSISVDHLAFDGTAGDQAAIVYNALTGTWGYRNILSGLNFKGVWKPSTNKTVSGGVLQDTDNVRGTVSGDYYVISENERGEIPPRGHEENFEAGDWIIYSGDKWQVISVKSPLSTIFGRVGNIFPRKDDYKWDDISKTSAILRDISNVRSASPATGDILIWDKLNSRFYNGGGYGTPSQPVDSSGIKQYAVETANILDGQVSTGHIGKNQIVTRHIRDDEVSTAKVARAIVPGNKFEARSVTSAKLATASIARNNIDNNNTILQNKFKAGAVSGRDFKDGAVTSSKIFAKTLTNPAKIADGAVTARNLQNDVIDATALGSKVIGANAFVDNSIGGDKIKDGTIETFGIKDKGLANADFSNNAFETSNFSDEAVTGDKIKTDAIQGAHIKDVALAEKHFEDGAVGTISIERGAIVEDKIKNNNITNIKIADNAVTSSKMGQTMLVGNTGGTINANAVMELKFAGTPKGFLPPRYTTIGMGRFSLGTSDEGMVIYNEDQELFYVWTGSEWSFFGTRNSCTNASPCAGSDADWKGAEDGQYIFLKGKKYGVASFNGLLWLDRNLGATALPSHYADPKARGSYYQWGRNSDGHELETSAAAAMQVTGGVAANHFVTGYANWITPEDNDLWQPASLKSNNPCPTSWRLPTSEELRNMFLTVLDRSNSISKFKMLKSPLKIIGAGFRDYKAGAFVNVGDPRNVDGGANQRIAFWSSTISGTEAKSVELINGAISVINGSATYEIKKTGGAAVLVPDRRRANAYPVRCVKKP